uniref:PQ loop repeat protein n=1 Tax=Megaviridae environmental sample TaxID=1737588 RepID=A0A5J6VIB9_9VIRU|nr:MAG: hypothetical protein [Megaviridae environmental sample]
MAQLFGLMGAITSCIASLPQVITSSKVGATDNLDIRSILVRLVSGICWGINGIQSDNTILAIGSFSVASMEVILLGFKIRDSKCIKNQNPL